MSEVNEGGLGGGGVDEDELGGGLGMDDEEMGGGQLDEDGEDEDVGE